MEKLVLIIGCGIGNPLEGKRILVNSNQCFSYRKKNPLTNHGGVLCTSLGI
jgi:hypothetical protein